MKDTTTERLTDILKKVKSPKGAEDFVEKYSKDHYTSFSEFINTYMKEHNLKSSDIVNNSEINKNYVYHIIRGAKHPSRDKTLALCIACGMNFTMTNRGLKANGCNPLDPKNPRDAYIAVCINMGYSQVTKVNIVLEENGLNLIEV